MLPLSPVRTSPRRRCGIVQGAFDRLSSDIALSFGLEPAALSSGRRSARVVLARQVAMYLGHVALGMRYEEIGRLTGRHRTTVAHACRRIEDRRDERDFDAWIETAERRLFAAALSRAQGRSGRRG